MARTLQHLDDGTPCPGASCETGYVCACAQLIGGVPCEHCAYIDCDRAMCGCTCHDSDDCDYDG